MLKSQLIDEIKALDKQSLIELLQEIHEILKRKKFSETPSLLDLAGLGYETWKDVDVEEYIKNERACWER